METIILPFVPSVTDVNPANAAAQQLQELVDKMKSEGWTFESLASMQTVVQPSGCASGIPGQSLGPEVQSIQLAVFKK